MGFKSLLAAPPDMLECTSLAMSTQTGPTVRAVIGPTETGRRAAGWRRWGVLPPEDAGGIAVDLGEEVFDAV